MNVTGKSRRRIAGRVAIAGALLLAFPISLRAADPVRADPYAWKNAQIVGGGFVSGIITHPTEQGLMYARTDIGGAYRRDSATSDWVPITDWIDQDHWTYTGTESLAIDPSDPNYVFIAGGSYTNDWSGPGAFLRSGDRGKTWHVTPVPFKMGGNEDGRGNGERLMVDPNDGRVLLFGSRKNGLWRSDDRSESWHPVDSFPDTGDTHGIGIVFVYFDPSSGKAGSPTPVVYAGVNSPKAALYRSTDGGRAWAALPHQPTGLVPHHIAADRDGTLYITYGDGPGPNGVTDGAVYKLDPKTDAWTDISPEKPGGDDKFGYAGVSVDPQHPGTLVVSTLDRWAKVDDLFRSTDGGKTWTGIREKSVRDSSLAPWLNWGKDSAPIGHWIADVEIDPADSNHLLYVTGWGMWESSDLTNADKGEPTHWKVAAKGIEECVVNDVVAPPAGEATVLSVMWDIDGFRHVDLDHSPPWGFFKPQYGRDTAIDFAQKDPSIVVRVYGGAPVGGSAEARTGGSYSTDNGMTWTAFPTKPAPDAKGDGAIAVSADGAVFVWTPENAPSYLTRDRGTTWTACGGLPPNLRVISDRADAGAFYAVDPATGTAYASTDGGASFSARAKDLPKGELYLRSVPDHPHDLYLAAPHALLASTDSGQTFAPVSGIQSAHRVGFGKAAAGQEYPAIFVVGRVDGAYGFFRSDDRGATWCRINDDRHNFGEITAITGDPRHYARVYIASRNRAILYGDPEGPK